MGKQNLLIEKLLTKRNKLDELAKKRIEKTTNKIETAFFEKFDGNINFKTNLKVICLSGEKKYFDDIIKLLKERGIETDKIELVLLDQKTGRTYYTNICKSSPFLSWEGQVPEELWYAMTLDAKLTDQAKTMIEQQSTQTDEKTKKRKHFLF